MQAAKKAGMDKRISQGVVGNKKGLAPSRREPF
jgi:hypothetical protein